MEPTEISTVVVIIPQSLPTKYWAVTTPQITSILGLSQATLRGWISRKQFPQPDGHVNGKAPFWYVSTVLEYVKNAPGGHLGYPVG